MISTTLCTTIGVGLDTARYGHHATFLREDRQPAAKPLSFVEGRQGYQNLQEALRQLAEKHPGVHFRIHVDAAGQYAANLLEFLRQLPWPKTISVGEPARNKKYREVHFPKRKADAVESHACARFAVVEQPGPSFDTPAEMRVLQEITSRLEFQVKQSTRQINRLHHLLARVFPELATLQDNLAAHWVLRLLETYPTAERLAAAGLHSIAAIPYLREDKAQAIHEAAKQSVATQRGELVEELVRQAVEGLRQSLQAESHLEKLLEKALECLPDQRARQVATICGIGPRTAAVLVAKIARIDRFPTAEHLVGFFGAFPEENTSGVDNQGRPIPPGTMHMSRKGNDLVRKYLWMAAWSAIGSNPPVKALYARLRARGRRGDVALGHCMQKLLHQVFAVWSSGQAFDPARGRQDGQQPAADPAAPKEEVAGRNTGKSPERKAVTATTPTIVPPAEDHKPTPAAEVPPAEPPPRQVVSVDYRYLRSQISMEQVLRHLGYFDRLRGGVQRRGPCPVHGSKRDRARTFSVHLGKNVFQCFHPPCQAAGNVLDLWCAVHRLTPHEGALSLAETFGLQPQPEKRNPSPEPVTSPPGV
jgi:transposase